MSAARTRAGGPGDATARLRIARKYLEVAELADSEAGLATNNVVVGVSVLAGIAAADAICLSALGERYAGTDHAEAVVLLRSVDRQLAGDLAQLVRLKPASHYGHSFIGGMDREKSLRAARRLVEGAASRS